MTNTVIKNRRAQRTRAKIQGTTKRPRLSVFRSNAHMYAQLIDDETGKTLVSAHSKELSAKGTKTDAAKQVGKEIATRAKKEGVESVVFDRGSYQYHGRVKALADAAREGGLMF